VKLAVRAKSDVLSEVVDEQRLTVDFVVSSGIATPKTSPLVRVQPGVLEVWRA